MIGAVLSLVGCVCVVFEYLHVPVYVYALLTTGCSTLVGCLVPVMHMCACVYMYVCTGLHHTTFHECIIVSIDSMYMYVSSPDDKYMHL